jgi:hypothetical protein
MQGLQHLMIRDISKKSTQTRKKHLNVARIASHWHNEDLKHIEITQHRTIAINTTSFYSEYSSPKVIKMLCH